MIHRKHIRRRTLQRTPELFGATRVALDILYMHHSHQLILDLNIFNFRAGGGQRSHEFSFTWVWVAMQGTHSLKESVGLVCIRTIRLIVCGTEVRRRTVATCVVWLILSYEKWWTGSSTEIIPHAIITSCFNYNSWLLELVRSVFVLCFWKWFESNHRSGLDIENCSLFILLQEEDGWMRTT